MTGKLQARPSAGSLSDRDRGGPTGAEEAPDPRGDRRGARGTTQLDALRAHYRAFERGLGARRSISGGSIERPYEPRPLDR